MHALTAFAQPTTPQASRHDRQIRAFGTGTQRRLRQQIMAIVGLGGAGSHLAQGLAHLGVGRLILVDPDTVDTTSLNRLVGATPEHARTHQSRVAVATTMIERIDPTIQVLAISGSILHTETWQLLRCADILLGAVDTHAARWALNSLATQYARCYIDVAVEITTSTTGTLDVAGHVATITPGSPCLLCLAGYDPRQVATELDEPLAAIKRHSGYLADHPDEPAPAVLFLNQAVTAIALAEVVNQAGPWRPVHPYVLLDLSTPAITAMHATPNPACPACGIDSARGLGDAGGIPITPSRVQPPDRGDHDGHDDRTR